MHLYCGHCNKGPNWYGKIEWECLKPFEDLHLFIAQHTVAMREQLQRKKKLCEYYTVMKLI